MVLDEGQAAEVVTELPPVQWRFDMFGQIGGPIATKGFSTVADLRHHKLEKEALSKAEKKKKKVLKKEDSNESTKSSSAAPLVVATGGKKHKKATPKTVAKGASAKPRAQMKVKPHSSSGSSLVSLSTALLSGSALSHRVSLCLRH